MEVEAKLKTAKFVLAIFGSTLIGACSLAATSQVQDPLLISSLETSVVATVNALNSATPVPAMTLPQASTDDVEPVQITALHGSATPTVPWGDFPAPTQPSSTDIPPPMPEIRFEPEVFNVLLLGTDQRYGAGGFRTDTLMIVSVDPNAKTATMISFPRDLYVYVPGWKMNRINTAMVHGGAETLNQTILYNFGIPVDAWARVDFSGFTSAIDTLGGITVESTAYVSDECRGIFLTYRSGVSYDMDGGEALCYVRMRKSGGDFDRMRRQQEVVRGIFAKVLSIDGLARIPQLYNQFFNMMITDIEVLDLTELVPTAAQIGADPTRIHQFHVDRDLVDSWRTPGGGAVLLPKRPEIRIMLKQAFGADAFDSME